MEYIPCELHEKDYWTETATHQVILYDDAKIVTPSIGYIVLKRFLDIITSALAIILLSPLAIVISLLIVLDDPAGSPIFVQDRCGKNGKLFKFYKFRTMHVDAEANLKFLLCKNEVCGPAFKITNDPRITRIGKFFRRTSLDELPQFFNVLKGDMSVVGPRPPLPREVVQYNAYQRQRLSVKPGLSCFWQVKPNKNSLAFDEWVELDLKYIRERNLWVDFEIMFKTVRVMFTGQGQ